MSAATTVCKCGHIFHRGDSAFCRKCGAKRDVSALHSMHPLHLAQAASPMKEAATGLEAAQRSCCSSRRRPMDQEAASTS